MEKLWIKSMYVCSPTCHQLPERSFYIGKMQMPICSRCLGIYIGMVLSLFINQPWLIFFAPITYIDGLIQLKTSYISNNRRRLITGIISGIGTVQLFKFIFSIFFNI